VERAIARLREAETTVTKAAALGDSSEVVDLSLRASVALTTLDYVWHECQKYRRKILGPNGGKLRYFYVAQFAKNYELLIDVRETLTGFGSAVRRHQEVEAGFIAHGSLLDSLREASSRAE
jgi:hypothetical protein